MNTINIAIDFTNGTNTIQGIPLISGDYASTKINFTFDREDGTKIFEMKNPSGEVVMVSEIIDNSIVLAAEVSGNNVSVLNEEGQFIYEVSLYVDDSKLTSVYGTIPVREEQVVIGDEITTQYLPIFDQLMQEINTAITETNNLNITAEKVDHTTTIEITNKDGETETIEILDGEKGDKGDKGDAGAIKMLIVAELPATGADDTIYLVPITPDTTGNNYAEYVYINGAWELLGKIGVQVDLTDYVKFTDYATSDKGGVIKTSFERGTGMSNSKQLIASLFTYSQYQNTAGDYAFIGKGTLENVITGKGLVSNTDYANGSKGGVVKISNGVATTIDNYGTIYPQTKTYTEYTSGSNNMFVGKGTLENVITGKGLTTKSYVDGLVGDIQTLLDNLDTGAGV